jgi:O-antigen/teichoic acid export membrane protein
MPALFEKLRRLRTGWLLSGQLSGALVQMIFFLVLARTLGPAEMGKLGAALALVSALIPFSLWGAGNLLIRDLARDQAQVLPGFGRALTIWAMTSLALCLAATLLLKGLLGVPLLPAFLLAVAEIACSRLVDLVGQAFQGTGDLRRMALVQVVLGVAKLGAVTGFAHFHSQPTAMGYLPAYCGACAGAALVALAWFRKRFGQPVFTLRPGLRELREGLPFSVGLLFAGGYGQLDKVILARSVDPALVGDYAVTTRVLAAAFMPIAALLGSTYTHFFKAGRHGVAGTFTYLKQIRVLAAVTAMASLAMALTGAAVLPLLFGQPYAAAARMLLLLSPLVLLQAAHYFMADALTGAGFQGLRSLLQGGAAVFNLAVCFWWVPLWGVRGALAASLVTHLLLVLAVAGALTVLVRRGPGRTA